MAVSANAQMPESLNLSNLICNLVIDMIHQPLRCCRQYDTDHDRFIILINLAKSTFPFDIMQSTPCPVRIGT